MLATSRVVRASFLPWSSPVAPLLRAPHDELTLIDCDRPLQDDDRSHRPSGRGCQATGSRAALVVLPPRRFSPVAGTGHIAARCRTWGSLRSDPQRRRPGQAGPRYTVDPHRSAVLPSKVSSSPAAVSHHCDRCPPAVHGLPVIPHRCRSIIGMTAAPLATPSAREGRFAAPLRSSVSCVGSGISSLASAVILADRPYASCAAGCPATPTTQRPHRGLSRRASTVLRARGTPTRTPCRAGPHRVPRLREGAPPIEMGAVASAERVRHWPPQRSLRPRSHASQRVSESRRPPVFRTTPQQAAGWAGRLQGFAPPTSPR